MKRTTVVIEEELFRKFKQEAVRLGESFKDHLNHVLARSLTFKKDTAYKLNWITVKGKKGPTIPLEDRDRLLDFMNERESR
jgi:hypothetical protein